MVRSLHSSRAARRNPVAVRSERDIRQELVLLPAKGVWGRFDHVTLMATDPERNRHMVLASPPMEGRGVELTLGARGRAARSVLAASKGEAARIAWAWLEQGRARRNPRRWRRR